MCRSTDEMSASHPFDFPGKTAPSPSHVKKKISQAFLDNLRTRGRARLSSFVTIGSHFGNKTAIIA